MTPARQFALVWWAVILCTALFWWGVVRLICSLTA